MDDDRFVINFNLYFIKCEYHVYTKEEEKEKGIISMEHGYNVLIHVHINL